MVEKEHRIEIASDPANIVEIESFVEQVRESIEIGDEIYGNIMICLTEAVNNAITHGNGDDPSLMVTIECSKEDPMVSFKVTDEGAGFDYNNLPDPTDPDNLEKLTGRGVFLMRQLSDYLIFANGGNTVEMQFRV